MGIKLDDEEKELLTSLENNEWESVPHLDAEIKRYQKIAEQTFNKNKRINLRISEGDFNAARVKALEEGLPYQTLLASIIHKFLMGRLVEKK